MQRLDGGAEPDALVEAARGSQTLKELNLHCNDFGPPLQAALEQTVASQECSLESLGAEGGSGMLEDVGCSVM